MGLTKADGAPLQEPLPIPVYRHARDVYAINPFAKMHGDEPTVIAEKELQQSEQSSLDLVHSDSCISDDVPKPLSPSRLPGSQGPSDCKLNPPPAIKPQRRIWFRPLSFIAFALLLFALMSGLIALQHFADGDHGFAIAATSNPYAWRYGPTAVLTVVIALWRQFDYQLKVQAPWVQMQSRPSRASKTILLDYLSPIWPWTIVKSLLNRHWPVALGLTVLLLLQLSVLLSTALLIAQSTPMLQSHLHLPIDHSANTSLQAADASNLIVTYYGMVAQGLTPPSRTTLNAAYQGVVLPSNLSAPGSMTARVRAFFPSLSCESARLSNRTYTSNTTDDGVHFNIVNTTMFTFKSDTCSTSPTELPALDSCGMDGSTCPPQQTVATTSGTNCTGDSDSLAEVSALALLVMEVENFPYGRQAYGRYTAMVCRPSYSIDRTNLTLSSAQHNNSINAHLSTPPHHTGLQLPSLSADLLLQQIVSIPDAYLPGVNDSTSSLSSDTTSRIDDYFKLIMHSGSISDTEDLFNETIISSLGERVFQGLASQWVGAAVPLGSEAATTGTYSWQDSRLHVAPSALMGMCVLLGLSALLVLSLCFFRTGLSIRPDDLAFRSAVLHRSDRLRNLLQGFGHASNKQLRSRLMQSFSMTEDGRICVHEAGIEAPRASPSALDPKPWRPLAARLPFALFTILIPIVLIGILEALQRRSDANQGLGDVFVSQTTAQQVASYLAAAFMLALAACSRAAEFDFAVFGPYHAMAGGASVRTARFPVLGTLAPVALVRSIGHKQVSVASAMVLAILGSTLTLIVSGLYSIEAMPSLHTTTAVATDHFNLSWSGGNTLEGTVQGETLYTLMEENNASYPRGTYNEIAYNLLELSTDAEETAALLESSQVQIDAPVLRPSLNCSVVPKQSVLVNVTDALYLDSAVDGEERQPGTYANVTVAMPLPPQCKASNASYAGASQLYVLSDPYMPVPSNGTLFNGQMAIPQTRNDSSPFSAASFDPVAGAGCPTLAFQFGRYRAGQRGNAETTVLVCSQYQESVLATLTFDVPSMALNTTQPPVLHEETARTVATTQYAFTQIFGFRIGALATASSHLDDFMDNLLYGTEGVPGAELLGAANEQRFQQAVQHVYRKFMVQVLSAAARVSGAPPAAQSVGTVRRAAQAAQGTLPARINAPARLRVVQQPTTKLVLQAVLAAMAAAALLSYLTMCDMRRLLYHNPCTIAGNMSLLADTHNLDLLTRAIKHQCGTASLDHNPLRSAHHSLNHAHLRLGWRLTRSGQRRYAIKLD